MLNHLKKRWVSAALIILICLIIAVCFGYSGDRVEAHAATVDNNYYFRNITVDIKVNRDKTFDITETLKTQFLEDGINTGIIRDIQRESTTTRVIDGVEHKGGRYLSGLDNVSVTLDGGEAKVTRSLYGSYHSIKMQKPDGYFDCGITFYWYYALCFGLALFGIAACVVIIIAGTMNKKVLAPVEFMPPEDLDIMHFSAVWHKGARYKDIGALVLQ